MSKKRKNSSSNLTEKKLRKLSNLEFTALLLLKPLATKLGIKIESRRQLEKKVAKLDEFLHDRKDPVVVEFWRRMASVDQGFRSFDDYFRSI